MCLIFWDRCWVVYLPFVCMVKFKFLAHLPVDHLARSVVSSLILLLCKLAAFAYNAIDCFIYHIISELSLLLLVLVFLLRIIDICHNIIGLYYIILACYSKLFIFPFLAIYRSSRGQSHQLLLEVSI